MQVDFINEVLYEGIPHFYIVEVRVEEPIEVRLDGVLVLEERRLTPSRQLWVV